MKHWLPRSYLIVSLFATSVAPAASAEGKPDLADMSVGTYKGDVISDDHGPWRANVTVIVTKSGPNSVMVQSNYDRIPARTFRLIKAMYTIRNDSRTEVFVLDPSQSPHKLDLTIDGATWSGTKTTA